MLKKILTRMGIVAGDELRADLTTVQQQLRTQAAAMERALIVLGEIRAAQISPKPADTLADHEFRIFSQFGDDGIISYLMDLVQPESKTFVEFGVESYVESNTRFLLLKRNWRGMVMDGSDSNVETIKRSDAAWRHDLTANLAFVTAENVNELLSSSGFGGKLGLLHIDIDGNDYWVWKAINCCEPDTVIVEYNAGFGPDRAITVPYDPAFVRSKAHPSHLYYGASLSALVELGESRGYGFVGCNSAGNNAYFVKQPLPHGLRVLTPKEGFVQAKFRETRDASGQLLFKTSLEGLDLIRGLPVVDVRTGKTEAL
ncbi:hypothetical protein Pan44_38960 [Caulifigura coniformis]|uniref:Uncharacterized protein n=1 Tax=Caulifigura coniformis TaxID=2527983 RepID=A0A517SI96_9PLAN|nr:hypothetical protein [Caulifigura coniformis]QDT55848.1 hypothetical protein Pan44_38960 [Caulifigura coniformis]